MKTVIKGVFKYVGVEVVGQKPKTKVSTIAEFDKLDVKSKIKSVKKK